jgi:predicted Zn-dependent protease
MSKVFLKGLLLLFMFFSIWFLFSQIDWMRVLRIEQVTRETEEKMGDLFLEFFTNEDKEITDTIVVQRVSLLVRKICESNDIDPSGIKVHILKNDDVNAFAIPGRHLIIYSGLIAQADNQQELCGVIGHELAHIELDHVMKKLVSEVGFGALVSITTGGTGTETIKSIAKLLSSSAFDRALEKEADLKSVEYLSNAEINPEGLAAFLEKMSQEEGKANQYLSWMSTHPESRKRAKYIREETKKRKTRYSPVLTEESWKMLVEEVD